MVTDHISLLGPVEQENYRAAIARYRKAIKNSDQGAARAWFEYMRDLERQALLRYRETVQEGN